MDTIRKSITFTKMLNDWVQSKVASGEYTNESEYVRDLVRRDKAKNSQTDWLEAELQAGLESGVSEKNVLDIMEEVEAKLKGNGNL